MRAGRTTFALWSFFSVGEDTHFAICNQCQISVSHDGRNTKSFNTSNLLFHLQMKHNEEFKSSKLKRVLLKVGSQASQKIPPVVISCHLNLVLNLLINDPRAQNLPWQVVLCLLYQHNLGNNRSLLF